MKDFTRQYPVIHQPEELPGETPPPGRKPPGEPLLRLRRLIWRLFQGTVVLGALVVIGALGWAGRWVHGVATSIEVGAHGPAFALATQIYARPFELRGGVDTIQGRLQERLEQLEYRRYDGGLRPLHTGEFSVEPQRWRIRLRAFRFAGGWQDETLVELRVSPGGFVEHVLDGDGRVLESIHLDPPQLGTITGGNAEERQRVDMDEVPDHLIDAVLTIEDRRFWDHWGIDFRRVIGAVIANVRAGRVVQGGSTLTQQLVKNYYLTSERTFARKLREAVLALVLDYRIAKVDLMAAYLTEVYLGQDGATAIHGFGSAARHFFGKPLGGLDLAESALLAGMVRGPSQYSPHRHPAAALARRDLVLRLMRQAGFITGEEFLAAVARPLGVRSARRSLRSSDYYLDFVIEQLGERFDMKTLEARGLSVYTGLDLQLQALAERAVREGVEALEKKQPRLRREESPLQAALVAIQPRTGEILALVGGRDYVSSPFNRAVDARRQPGSVFKPIVALTAISRRDDADPEFDLASTLQDAPFRLTPSSGLVGSEWTPHNYSKRYRGIVTLREALEQSLNVPMARLGVAVGSDEIVATARKLGIDGPLRSVPSIALGASEVSPLEITRAYSVLANGGLRPPFASWNRIVDADELAVEDVEPVAHRVFDEAEVYLVTSALQGVVARGTARALPRLGYLGPAVGKTGTTNGLRDAWFVGYTPELAVGVWVGFDDGEATGMTGGGAALPIFAAFMQEALGPDGGTRFQIPPGVEYTTRCGQSEYFLAGTHSNCRTPARNLALAQPDDAEAGDGETDANAPRAAATSTAPSVRRSPPRVDGLSAEPQHVEREEEPGRVRSFLSRLSRAARGGSDGDRGDGDER